MKKTVLLTGATGGMGLESLKQMLEDKKLYTVRVLVRDSEKNRGILKDYMELPNLEVIWGDLNAYDSVLKAVKDTDLILHVAAFVSPQADYYPKKAMEVNFGGTRNLIDAIKECGQADSTKFVYIGTVAETGDRMPPIHWGRVGDPIKPSMYDYYAVSKVAAERLVIDSGLRYWVSLRQTGIMGPAMAKVRDSIQFHNCLDNVLEYVSDRDSGRAMRNLSAYECEGTLDHSFWGHIYNIGGGKSCRVSTEEMYKIMYGELGFTSLDPVIEPQYVATRNFHGHFYLDSDKLEEYLHFRGDSMEYFYEAYLKELGAAKPFAKVICKVPGGQKLMGSIIRGTFKKLMLGDHGTKQWIMDHDEDHIEAYWGSEKAWKAIPKKDSQISHFTDWEQVIRLDHGYDETKPEAELDLKDVQAAAEFRGGSCDSKEMAKGDWTTPLDFTCQFGHRFKGSPRLILEGGHWCDECERKSWNYGRRAKKDRFFAQVWEPLHEQEEMREFPKSVSELDV